MYTRIVVPLDGSDVAEQALESATEMARLTDAPIHLVRILDLHASGSTYVFGYMVEAPDAGYFKAEQEVAAQYLAETALLLEQQGLAVTHELRHGSAAAGIVEVLEAGDLLVMASHGRSGMSRWFLGSVAESVIRNATVPVLLVRVAPAKATRTSARDKALAHTT
jgi:nucleotide-binding universal stress UspA family protein